MFNKLLYFFRGFTKPENWPVVEVDLTDHMREFYGDDKVYELCERDMQLYGESAFRVNEDGSKEYISLEEFNNT